MKTAKDYLEQAKCGTVIIDLPTAERAKEVFEELCLVSTNDNMHVSVWLEDKRIIINPS